MYPHERSLVKRMEGKPFALVGVNSDQSKEELKKAMEKEHITWRSFWDGGSTNGPIATRWNVQGWPTIYVLDDKGVIRYKNTRGEAMDDAVDALLKKMGVEPPKKVEEPEKTEKSEKK
jgi:Thioredoxin-like